MISQFISHLLSLFFEPLGLSSGDPAPLYYTIGAIARRNYINGSISLITIIVGIFLFIAALRCYKKYCRSHLKYHILFSIFLFILAIIFWCVPLFAHYYPLFFPSYVYCLIYPCQLFGK